eukprot:1150580-Pelagomonas_calceolata.AAC.5
MQEGVLEWTWECNLCKHMRNHERDVDQGRIIHHAGPPRLGCNKHYSTCKLLLLSNLIASKLVHCFKLEGCGMRRDN